jgi:hypothetical protein
VASSEKLRPSFAIKIFLDILFLNIHIFNSKSIDADKKMIGHSSHKNKEFLLSVIGRTIFIMIPSKSLKRS